MDFSPQQKADLGTYETLLRKWQRTINLVAPSTLDYLWERHFQDSAQLLDLAPQAKSWIDLGSGGGFPGLVVAILGKDRPVQVHLVESDQRKAAFLRTVSRETKALATVHAGRIESILETLPIPDVISARALAPLAQLLAWSEDFIEKGATALFMKGQDVDAELKAIPNYSRFVISKYPSQTDVRASIVKVTRG
jgi:16S rRNA (guanine527-N7)-methyltransferase